MQCSKCGHDNRVGAKFCEECAAPLARACASCGTQLSPTAKFCPECARPASAEVPHPRFISPETYTPRHLAEKILTSKTALEGERKQVTILFADLKGSMEVLADRDPEDARKILDAVVERMMEAVHHFEGTVSEVRGDGIMALFGAPLAHEDHAIRASYAALRMQEAVKRYADELRRSEGLFVQIRVGINSGDVVVRSIGSDLRMDYSAVGRATHMAARMEQLAAPGSTQLTADTLRLAEGFVDVTSLGAVPIKGLAEPVEVFELVGAGAARTRLEAAARRGLTRFVGRKAELEQLRDAFDQTSLGRGHVVAVVGEPGVGKSRLVHEFAHSQRLQGWLVLESATVPYGKATSYLPVIDLLKDYFKIQDRDEIREIREKVTGKLLTLDESLRRGRLPLLALLDVPFDDASWNALDPAQRRRRTLDAVRRLLLREARVQPLLLIFEDLHWIDGETQSLLDSLVEGLPTARLLLLVTYRPDYRHAWGNKTYYRQLRVDQLPPDSADELLDTLLGTDAAASPLKRLLIERTEANPLFLEESVRSLVETGALAGERGAYRLARPLEQLKMPATVQAILAARIDRLAPEAKRLLQAAAVIGKVVPMALLLAIADAPEQEVRADLPRLQAAEFLYEAGFFPEIEYTFKHALTHEVAFGSLVQDRRRALHMRIVETIERTYPDRLSEHADRLARHAFLGEEWIKAATYLQQAGAKALARSAHREAVTRFEEALRALTHLPETQKTLEQAIDLRFGLRNALLPLAEWARIEGYLREARALAWKISDRRRIATVSGYMAGLHLNTDCRAGDIRAFAQEVEAIGVSLGDVPLQAAGLYYHVWLGTLSGDYRGTERFCRTLIDALPGDLSYQRFDLVAYPAVVSRAFLARTLAELGMFGEGGEHGQEAVRLAEELDHPFSLIWSCLNLGRLEGLRGEFTRAIRLLERAAALSREWKIAYLTPIALAGLGHVYVESGRVEEGVSRLQQALAGYGTAGIGYLLSMSKVQFGEACLLVGRVEEARDCSTRALALARERGERGHEAWAHRLLGETASHRDCPDVAAAETHYATSAALASELGMRPLVAHCHFSLGKLKRRAGDRRAAKEDFTKAMNLFREMGMRFWFEMAGTEMEALQSRGQSLSPS